MDTIGQNSLHGELLGRVRKLIVIGELAPGTKVQERELCKRFGVSRTPLREALKVLAAEGFVRLEPHRGAIVAEFTPGELEECLPISATVEATIGELACQYITDEEIAAIRLCHDEMIAAFKAKDYGKYVDCNIKIHESLLAAARNPLLATIYDATFFRIGRTRLTPSMSPELYERTLADHEKIMNALETRQCEQLASLLRAHIEGLFDVYRELWNAAAADAHIPEQHRP